MGSIVLGLLVGCVAAYCLGMIHFSDIHATGSLNIPVPLKYGLRFDVGTIVGLGLIYLVTAVEAFGDITANSLISGEPVEGPVFMSARRAASWPTVSTPCWPPSSTASPIPSSPKTTA